MVLQENGFTNMRMPKGYVNRYLIIETTIVHTRKMAAEYVVTKNTAMMRD